MDIVIVPLFKLVLVILDLYSWAIIVQGLLSLLVAFQVVNPHNSVVGFILNALGQITEPVYRPIRQFLPTGGGIDFSPLVVLLAIYFIQSMLHQVLWKLISPTLTSL